MVGLRGQRAALAAFVILALSVAVVSVVRRDRGAEHSPAQPPPTPSAIAITGPVTRITVRSRAGAGMVELVIDSTRPGLTGVVEIDPAGAGANRRRMLTLSTASSLFTMHGLPPGTARWTVRAPGARTVHGWVVVPPSSASHAG